jgi:hypothetical protein
MGNSGARESFVGTCRISKMVPQGSSDFMLAIPVRNVCSEDSYVLLHDWRRVAPFCF